MKTQNVSVERAAQWLADARIKNAAPQFGTLDEALDAYIPLLRDYLWVSEMLVEACKERDAQRRPVWDAKRGTASGEILNDEVAGEVARHREMKQAMVDVYGEVGE